MRYKIYKLSYGKGKDTVMDTEVFDTYAAAQQSLTQKVMNAPLPGKDEAFAWGVIPVEAD